MVAPPQEPEYLADPRKSERLQSVSAVMMRSAPQVRLPYTPALRGRASTRRNSPEPPFPAPIVTRPSRDEPAPASPRHRYSSSADSTRCRGTAGSHLPGTRPGLPPATTVAHRRTVSTKSAGQPFHCLVQVDDTFELRGYWFNRHRKCLPVPTIRPVSKICGIVKPTARTTLR